MQRLLIVCVVASLFSCSSAPSENDLRKHENRNKCFSGDCRNGTGVFITSNFEYYAGEFKDGKFHGRGERYYGGKLMFKGEFKNGRADGRGTEYSGGAITYTGEYRNGKWHGKGMVVGKDTEYEGEFNNGGMTGKGVLIGKNGIKYEGDFLNGKMHGTGTLTSEKFKYDGEWQGFYPHGNGTFYQTDGTIILRGTWKKGLGCSPVVGDCINGSGTRIMLSEPSFKDRPKYWKYEGEWKNEKYHGAGTLIWPNGGKEVGYFVKGVYLGTRKPDEMRAWVKAAGGLRLRDRPSADGRIVFVIPDFSEVNVLEETGDIITISGASGKWSRVRYKDETGWAFGGFLNSVEPDRAEIRNALSEKLKGFPRNWTELTLINGRYYIYKYCHAQVRGITIDMDGSMGPEIIRGLGQESDQYLILDVVITKVGAVFTLREKLTAKSEVLNLEMIKEPDGKKVLWKWSDGRGQSFHVAGNYFQGGGTRDFPSMKERGGNCGRP